MLREGLEDVNPSRQDKRSNSGLRYGAGGRGCCSSTLDGLMIASALPESEQERVAAISAAMLSLGEKATSELDRGALQEIYVKGDRGYTLMTSVGDTALLLVLAKADAQLGLIFVDMKRMAESLVEIL